MCVEGVKLIHKAIFRGGDDLWASTRSECQYIHKMEPASPAIMSISGFKYVMIWINMYFGFQINCTKGVRKPNKLYIFVSGSQEYAWL